MGPQIGATFVADDYDRGLIEVAAEVHASDAVVVAYDALRNVKALLTKRAAGEDLLRASLNAAHLNFALRKLNDTDDIDARDARALLSSSRDFAERNLDAFTIACVEGGWDTASAVVGMDSLPRVNVARPD